MSSTYIIDLDHSRLCRIPQRSGGNSAALHNDTEWIELACILECVVGAPMRLLINLHKPNVDWTSRSTTNVSEIGALARLDRLPDAEAAFMRKYGGLDGRDPLLQAEFYRAVEVTAAKERSLYADLDEFAKMIHTGLPEVRRFIDEGVLLHQEGLGVPRWQEYRGELPKWLPRIVAAVKVRGNIRQTSWIMVTSQHEIEGRTPVHWLIGGGAIDVVVRMLLEESVW